MAGGGFGEAALMSAVVGGGLSAAKGEDPLKGALLGGLLGGATGGIGNLLGGASAAAPAALGAETALAGSLAAPVAESTLLGSAASPFAGQAATQAAQIASATAANPALAAEQLALGQGAAQLPSMNTLASQVPAAQSMAGATSAPSSGGLGDLFNKFGALSTPEKLLYGSTAALAAPVVMGLFKGKEEFGGGEKEYDGPLSQFSYDPRRYKPLEVARPVPYRPTYVDYRRYAGGGPIEEMSNANSVGANTGYPMANIGQGAYATPYQQPIPRNVVSDASDTGVNPMTGEMTFALGGIAAAGKNPMSGRPLFRASRNAAPSTPVFGVPTASAPVARPVPYKARYAQGGISDLGGYSDYARGGRMLKGPGDGMSDDIPAKIADKQPARLANEEFVIPADVVSHLGNGSSEAGAKQLYKMMDRVRQARTGTKKQGKKINPEKYLA